jgi:chloramphenicol O-acetyltransferase
MYLNLDSVISNKKGDTFSLCLIYYDVAKAINVHLEFCMFDDYCMLRMLENNDELYIDLSGNGNLLSKDEVKLLLQINYINFNKRKILDIDEVYELYLNRLISLLPSSDFDEITEKLEFFKEELFF